VLEELKIQTLQTYKEKLTKSICKTYQRRVLGTETGFYILT